MSGSSERILDRNILLLIYNPAPCMSPWFVPYSRQNYHDGIEVCARVASCGAILLHGCIFFGSFPACQDKV